MTDTRKKKDKVVSIEELYKNKNFVPPKEKNLETIFEEPRKSKDGAPMLTSVKKFKRYLHFDTTVGKIHKRKVRAKKCMKKMKLGNLKTRSAAKTEECLDILMHISEVIGESSDSEMDTKGREISFTDHNQSQSDLDSPRTSVNNDNSKSESKQSMPNSSTSIEDESGELNSTPRPNFDADTSSSATFPYERLSSDKALEEEEETKDSSRSSCAIT